MSRRIGAGKLTISAHGFKLKIKIKTHPDKNGEKEIMPLATVNGIKLNYRVEGHGEPLVMIMGFSANRSGWISQIPFFRKHFRVVTFDNRGVGKSDKPEGPYSIKMMADDTAGLMGHLKIEKAHVLGVSMGGMIAQELAINYPEKVDRLVLASTFAVKDETSGDTPEQAGLLGLPPRKLAVAMAKLASNKPFYRFASVTPAMVRSCFIKASARAGIEGQTVACNTHNTLDRLSLIKAPTLVITGTDDRIIKPVSSEVIARNIPGATLDKIEGGSHASFAEMKTLFNRKVLDFLKPETPAS